MDVFTPAAAGNMFHGMPFHALSWRHGHPLVVAPKTTAHATGRRAQPERPPVRPHATPEAEIRRSTGSTSHAATCSTACRETRGDPAGGQAPSHTASSTTSRTLSRRVTPVDTWLLAVQFALDLVLVALLGFFVWKARVLVDTLAKAARGTEWANGKMAEAFSSAAASIELTATAAAASSVAIQTLVRDVRPLLHEQSETVSVDLTGLIDPDV